MIKTIKQYKLENGLSTQDIAVKFGVVNTCVWRMEKKNGVIIDDVLNGLHVQILTNAKYKIEK